jgi:hypothetical protein
MPSLLRSFFAVMVGFMVMMLTVVVLTLIFVKTMGQHSGHPTPAYLAVNVVYSLLAASIGGFATAAVAKVKPVRHGAALAAVMFVLSVLSYLHDTGGQPVWYRGMLMIVPSLCAVAGAALYARNAPAGFV